MRGALAGSLVVLGLLACARAAAQEPSAPVGARVQARSAAEGLEDAVGTIVSTGGDQWIGYEVPTADDGHVFCCHDSGHVSWGGEGPWNGCRLHATESGSLMTRERRSVRLRSERSIRVLLRVARGSLQQVRIASSECELDAGDETLTWLSDVSPAQSVALLAARAEHRDTAGTLPESAPRRVATEAVRAIGVHQTPDAIDALIHIGRGSSPEGVRGQALFWLARAAGERAVATLESVVDTDPDVDIKNRAVFALGQLPSERGVPLLIRVARTHASPSVRRRAVFWLGQSDDAMAFDFIVGLLEGGKP
ncbi:MAG TPA: HEAT repeat domain-containing protein [Acidobacteriota bacterium]|nr:HEAT repeat domain-containing protein [Acidobacteriota bacterium]